MEISLLEEIVLAIRQDGGRRKILLYRLDLSYLSIQHRIR